MPFFKQVISIYGANTGLLDGAEAKNVRVIEEAFLSFIERDRKEIMTTLETGRELTDEVVEKLNTAIADFKEAHAQYYVA
jgi:F0F1-type ATP synthase alpha subunit